MAQQALIDERWKPLATSLLYRLCAPHVLTVVLFFPVLVLYWWIPAEVFMEWWESPKIGNVGTILYFAVSLLIFGFGSAVGASFSSKTLNRAPTTNESQTTYVQIWYIRIGLLVSIFAYLLWFGLTLKRAGGIAPLIVSMVIDPFYVKSDLMKTVPGVTTLTQVAVMAIPLALCSGKMTWLDRGLICTVIALAAVRSFFYSERLALLEVVVPALFLLATRQKVRRVVVLAGLSGVATSVLAIFILLESSRSFVYKGITTFWGLVEAGMVRFVGYYVTSINNANLLVEKLSFDTPLYSVLSWVWSFPGVGNLYQWITGLGPINFADSLAERGLNPEFNTSTAIGSWVSDFGIVGAPIVVVFFGMISGMLHRLSPKSELVAPLYAVWIVGLLEFMRIPYFTGTRMFPAFLFFAGALMLARANAKRVYSQQHAGKA